MRKCVIERCTCRKTVHKHREEVEGCRHCRCGDLRKKQKRRREESVRDKGCPEKLDLFECAASMEL